MYRIFLGLLLCTLLFTSCKDKTNDSQEPAAADQVEPVKKIELSPEEIQERKDMANSVMAKTMVIQDASSFSRALVTLGMTDMLSQLDTQYTVLAPNNEAFKALGSGQNIVTDPEKREALKTLIQGHIIKNTLNSATLVQEIKKNSKLEATDLNGNTLTFTLQDNDIVVTNAAGSKAVVGKSDISGSNGVLHILDAILE